MHSDLFAGIGKYDFANVTIPTANKKNALGVTAFVFAVDDIPNTLFLVEPDGTINYNNISTHFSSADYGFLLSYARKIENCKKKIKMSILGLMLQNVHRQWAVCPKPGIW